MKKLLCLLLILTFSLPLFGCESTRSYINDVNIKEFCIIYADEDGEYAKRAAKYIQDTVEDRIGITLPLFDDDEVDPGKHEIVVGNTNRAISQKLDAECEGLEFAILADNGSVALEADYFVIAAAAYFFTETCIPMKNFEATVPEEIKIHTPIVKEAKNFILLIGDGMGVYQTQIFDYVDNDIEYGDGEDIFYGYLLPYQGYSRTSSLSGVTDSAAGGTALSTGYKTYNEYIGRDKDQNDIMSLTELACTLGMGGGVMSTETDSGATPASFSTHADSRNSSSDIIKGQAAAKQKYGMHLQCGFDFYDEKNMDYIEDEIVDMLKTLEANEKGFFLMYEEAHIDKHCHNNKLDKAMKAIVRFNQAIARFMEYAFYNPETFVLITADHETGDLYPNEEGVLEYHHDDHTGANVKIFAYGDGAELFDGVEIENVQIAHTIAYFMGVEDFGDQSVYKHLGK